MPTDQAPPAARSGAQLVRSTLLALTVAVVVLVTCVLPAEYGVDPTGVGRLLGLTQMGETKRALAEEAEASAQAAAEAERLAAVADADPAPGDSATLAERRAVLAMVATELERRPAAAREDLYTLLYHGAMGPAHAGRDSIAVLAALTREVASLGDPSTWSDSLRDVPVHEAISPDGEMVRVNLRPFVQRGGSIPALSRAFVRSAHHATPAPERLERWWRHVADGADAGEVPFLGDSLRAFFDRQRSSGFPAVEHSAAYRSAYRPAYRVLRRVDVPPLGD